MREKIIKKDFNKLFLKSCAGQFFSSITYDILTCLNRSIQLNNKNISIQKLTFLYSLYSLPNIIFPLFLSKLIKKLNNKYYKSKSSSEINQLFSLFLYLQIVCSSILFIFGIHFQSYLLLCLSRLIFGFSDYYFIIQNKTISEMVNGKFYGFYISLFYGSGKIGSAILFYKTEDFLKNNGKLFICFLGIISAIFGFINEIYGYFLLINNEKLINKNKEKLINKEKFNNKFIKLDKNLFEVKNKISFIKLITNKISQLKEFFNSLINKQNNSNLIKKQVISSKILPYFFILLAFSYTISSSSSFSNISPVIFQIRYHTKLISITTKELATMELTSFFISIVLNIISDFFDYRIYLVIIGSSILILSHLLILNTKLFLIINKPKIISIFLGIANPLINCYSPFLIKCISDGENKHEVLGKAFSIMTCISSIASVITPIFIGFLSKTDLEFFNIEIFYLIINIISLCLIFLFLFKLKKYKINN